MASSHLNAFCRVPTNARTAFMMPVVLALLLLAGIFFSRLPAAAQERALRDAAVKQVANDVYFFFDFSGSNSVFLVTEEGVLVIDTRTHPRDGRDLLDRIRKVTDKPIK